MRGIMVLLLFASGSVLAQDAKDAEECINRGNAWLRTKDYAKAIAEYESAARFQPNHPIAFYNLGNAWMALNHSDNAIRNYTEAIRLDPNDGRSFANRGNAWMLQKDFPKAIRDFDAAIASNPKVAGLHVNRGNAHVGAKDDDRAIRDFDEALRIDPENVPAFHGRAESHVRRKNYAAAVKDFDQAMFLWPTDAIRTDYARFLATCPDADYRDGADAVELMETVVRRAEGRVDVDCLLVMSMAYAEVGAWDKAIARAKSASAEEPLSADRKAHVEELLELYRAKKAYRRK